MISFSSNLGNVINTAIERLNGVDLSKMTREQASTLMAIVKERVHVKGLDSNNSQIGTYSRGYLNLRSGQYKNSERFSKGAKKGKTKNSGSFSKGSKTGVVRPNYNRGTNPKVILSLTRQMENDMIIKPIQNGWGIGYSNNENFKKAEWAESTYHKRIWNLTEEEHNLAVQIAEKYIENANKGNSR